MKKIRDRFALNWTVIIAGILIGLAAFVLQQLGNPKNMGFCMACFTRDIAGAIGLHRASVVQYIRPEIIGLVLGSLLSAFFSKEFKPRAGSSPAIRFFLGVFAMIGALVFLGCPWRAILRLGGGDLNAVLGILGLIFGIFIGTLFMRRGYDLGKKNTTKLAVGLVFPLLIIGLLILLFVFPQIDGQSKNSIVFYSTKGPGAQHAPLFISLFIGAIVGIVAQRSRFCTIGGFRDMILFRKFHLVSGVFSLLITVTIFNLIFGQFSLGFEGQPVAHSMGLWNFLGMVLSGLAFVLAGGCPGRQMVLAGEGDSDAGIFVIGMLVGAAIAHNFLLTASPKGIGTYSAIGVIFGLIVLVVIGITNREQ
jgi:uncharacterized protein